MSFYSFMILLQGSTGVAIVLSAVVLIAMGCDKTSPLLQKALLAGLCVWGVWFTWLAFNGQHDSVPAVALGACVAFVIIKNGKRIVGLLRGETWNPRRNHPIVHGTMEH